MTEGSESGGSHRKESASLAVLVLLVPGHLDGFEFAFVGELGVAGEAVKLADASVKIGEADGERVGGGVLVGKPNADLFRVVPIEGRRHELKTSSKYLARPGDIDMAPLILRFARRKPPALRSE